jgi:hypothetical protein
MGEFWLVEMLKTYCGRLLMKTTVSKDVILLLLIGKHLVVNSQKNAPKKRSKLWRILLLGGILFAAPVMNLP